MQKLAEAPRWRSRKIAAKPTTNAPVADLRDWLARVDALGELIRVGAPVDRDEEMSAISYLVAKQHPSPAVLFEQPRGFEKSPVGARLLWNILGPSIKRVALTLEEPAETPTVELIRRVKDKLKRRIPPREVPLDQAPVYEHTLTGKDIDLDLLPIPRHWPLDGGRYAGTGDAVITRDPDSGYLNIGTYRMMVQGKSQVGLYLSPGKDARLHITRAWQQGKPIHVAAAWGIDPLFMLVGSQTFPKNVSEYEYAGGIKGEPIPVVRGTTTDLMLPANAELVIEGTIQPNSVKAEGPFGEFPGYYGRPEAGCPLVDVTAVHYRTRPILTNALMADYPSCEQSGFFSVIRSAKIWDDLDKLGVPGIQGVYAHPAAAGGFGMTVISLEQRHAGHAAQVLALAAQVPGGGAALMALQQVEGGLAALVNWYSFRWRVLLGDAALGPALLRALAGAGHGAQVLIADGNYPFATPQVAAAPELPAGDAGGHGVHGSHLFECEDAERNLVHFQATVPKRGTLHK